MRETAMEFRHVFTPREAESALPLVRRIVMDILETSRALRGLTENDPAAEGFKADRDDLLLELEEMGCYFKDWSFEIGLVDFPAEIDGETVFLCWKSDESGLSWYHPVDEGFQGRRPIPTASAVE
jgi:hypothetical protein